MPTGLIDFAVNSDDEDADLPSEFKLLVEEHGIVEGITGNPKSQIQWRLATIEEAKVVVRATTSTFCRTSRKKLPKPSAVLVREKKDAQLTRKN